MEPGKNDLNRGASQWQDDQLRVWRDKSTVCETMNHQNLRIVVYYCRNLGLFALRGDKAFLRSHPGVRLVAVPCSSKVEAGHFLKTLAGGASGVLVAACDVRACRFVEGAARADKRLVYARSWLAELGMEEERIAMVHLPPKAPQALEEALNEFASRLEGFIQGRRAEAR